MKQTVEIQFEPTLDDIPEMLTEIAAVIEKLPRSAVSSESAHALEIAGAQASALQTETENLRTQNEALAITNKKLSEEIHELIAAPPRVEYRDKAPDMVPLWLTKHVLHCKQNCGQISRSSEAPASVWMERNVYETHKSLGRESKHLCMACHGWITHAPHSRRPLNASAADFGENEMPPVGSVVCIKPHGPYKSWTRGTVKDVTPWNRRVSVMPKGHGHPEWFDILLLRKVLGATEHSSVVDAQSV